MGKESELMLWHEGKNRLALITLKRAEGNKEATIDREWITKISEILLVDANLHGGIH